jgi:hypothetical protein
MINKLKDHMNTALVIIILVVGFYLLNGKIERQITRTDRLYEMFINLLQKEK